MVRTPLLEALEERNPVCTHDSTYASQQQRDFDSFDFRIFQNSNSCPSHTEPCLPLSCHRSLSHSLISLFFTPSESIPLCVTFRTDLAPVFSHFSCFRHWTTTAVSRHRSGLVTNPVTLKTLHLHHVNSHVKQRLHTACTNTPKSVLTVSTLVSKHYKSISCLSPVL